MEKTLVILAAGSGSRFGGMKQIEPVGPNGEFIMDYSIYSALKYGFNKVVLIIREEYHDLFKEKLSQKWANKIRIEYAYQNISDVPSGLKVPEEREKPWGTAHAIYAARNLINGNFGVISADDFYGDNAFKVLSDHLSKSDNYVIVGYNIGDTLSANGAVKRGVVLHENGVVSSIVESSCELIDDKVKCVPLDSSISEFYVEKDHPCSMLLNGFTKEIIDSIANDLESAFKNADDLLNYEMLLPDIMDNDIKNGKKVDVINTTSKWIGMTYKEDVINVTNFIIEEIEKGIYPNDLWN